MNAETTRERLNVVLAGHVDHGKSTILGRLLADSGALRPISVFPLLEVGGVDPTKVGSACPASQGSA